MACRQVSGLHLALAAPFSIMMPHPERVFRAVQNSGIRSVWVNRTLGNKKGDRRVAFFAISLFQIVGIYPLTRLCNGNLLAS